MYFLIKGKKLDFSILYLKVILLIEIMLLSNITFENKNLMVSKIPG